MASKGIESRKKDHVELTANEGTQYKSSTGFDRYEFIHNALPEVDFNEVSTQAEFLGQTFSFPLFISSMTGGYEGAASINAIIAEFCEENNLPFGIGSQRAMLENPNLTETFAVVRKKAPNSFICSNIGGAQLIGGLSKSKTSQLIDSIEANAAIVHLNPLQELMQPEGDRNFKGILDGIQQLVEDAGIPVIVKETGAGISKQVAEKLLNIGVSVIDVSGAGGTSWARVENARKEVLDSSALFNEWGISTVKCVADISELKTNYKFEMIASGGIRSAFDIAKAFALGADFAATAQPIIKAIVNDGREGLEKLFDNWSRDLKIILTLLGCNALSELNNSHIQIKNSF